ncbi:zinc finger protein CONSTANS-LIKE 2-like isoform X2 [Rhodamnia argentea]|uniref:Zinc finger protein CONSTANS-LIKE 2-like isoform X2 n=1 Tax=Rhodamnia argentea TaxID=178133 RepID=A0ABM3HWC1_9MYRT|nr:zinc finger protein CONSTANS-LIKE 2-like isoform X2 [Rhodamnia argentea]
MSSSYDLYACDEELQFLSDPFFPFTDTDSHIDILQSISDTQNPLDESPDDHSLHQLSSSFLSSSPPCYQLGSLSLYQANQLQTVPNGSNMSNGAQILGGYEVKSEEPQLCNEAYPYLARSYSGPGNVAKYLQRNYSSNSVDGSSVLFHRPLFDAAVESPDFQSHQALSSPEHCLLGGQIRRACSTGDLQSTGTPQSTPRSFSSPLATESSFTEEANAKVGRYSAEERKERILKYRAKRTQRNFNKTIKYACRKTLADNRPRIRGRFARNDETGYVHKVASSARDDDDEEFWMALHEEEQQGGRGGPFFTTYSQPQFQYYGY